MLSTVTNRSVLSLDQDKMIQAALDKAGAALQGARQVSDDLRQEIANRKYGENALAAVCSLSLALSVICLALLYLAVGK